MNPEAATLHEQARALLAKKQGAEAGALMEKVIALLGEDLTADAASDHGRALFQQGRVDEALERFSTAVELDDANPKYRLNRALLLEQKGDLGLAAHDLAEVLEVQPEREEVRWMAIRCLVGDEDLIGAQVQLDELIERNPRSAPALGERARLHIKFYDFEAAEADLQAAEALGAQPPEVQVVLDKAREELAAAQGELGGASEALDGIDLAGLLGGKDDDELLTPLEATLGTAMLIAFADGETSASELKAVKNLVQLLVAPELDDEAMNEQTVNSMMNVGISNRDDYLDLIVRSIPEAKSRAAAFLVATAVSTADGKVSGEERALLDKIAAAFELPASAVEETIRKAKKIFPAS